MNNTCTTCSTPNRPIARHCKKCGTRLSSCKPEELDDLIGMEDVKKEINRITTAMTGCIKDGLTYSDRLHTIVMGNTGVGKTKLVHILASIYHKYNVIKKDTPMICDAVDYADFNKNFVDNYKKAKGNILCIENVHKLIPLGDDQSVVQLDRIFLEMSKQENRYDPIIILSGHPYGLREYLNKKENVAVRSKFPFIFTIPDFDSIQLAKLTEADMAKNGFSLPDDARIKLTNVYKYILKQDRIPGKEPEARNAWLAQKTAENIRTSYWNRIAGTGSGERLISAADITGNVETDKTLDQVLADLDGFIGMHNIKNEVRGLIRQVKLAKMDEAEGGKAQKLPEFHVTLTGNPGTGKTVIARKLGEIFRAIGILELGHVVEVDRSKVIAQFVGQTAPNVNALCDKAMGGVLFIDEVYTLKQDDNDRYGQEAIDTLLKRMEDDRGKFIVVVAGYRDKMNAFMNSNDGLPSRFKKKYQFHIEDYNAQELLDIFKKIASDDNNRLDPSAEEPLKKQFDGIYAQKDKAFGNGRGVRNLYDDCVSKRSERLEHLMAQPTFDKSERTIIRVEDLPFGKTENKDVDSVLKELDKLTGLDAVKKEVRTLISYLQVEKRRSDQGGKDTKLNLHLVFRGSPGTGKTTVARIVAEIFKVMGLLSKGHLVEVDRSGLCGEYLGKTAPKTNGVIDNAMGGVLFIDEAYSLVGDAYGKEAINTLLKRMEDDRGKFIAIVAGYQNEMETFLNSNPGLSSRFTTFIDFDDYNPIELQKIFMSLIADKGMRLDQPAEQRLKELLTTIFNNRDSTFANGRAVRNIFEKSLRNQGARVAPLSNDTPDMLNTITADDITA